MISKELFVETINFMKERNDTVDRINREISVEFEDSAFYPYFRYEEMLVKVLEATMHDENEWIRYFLYEGNYGEDLKPDSVSEADGTPIDIITSEKLYDFLVEEYTSDEKVKEEKA